MSRFAGYSVFVPVLYREGAWQGQTPLRFAENVCIMIHEEHEDDILFRGSLWPFVDH